MTALCPAQQSHNATNQLPFARRKTRPPFLNTSWILLPLSCIRPVRLISAANFALLNSALFVLHVVILGLGRDIDVPAPITSDKILFTPIHNPWLCAFHGLPRH